MSVRYELLDRRGEALGGKLELWRGRDHLCGSDVQISKWVGDGDVEAWRRQVCLSAELNHAWLSGPLELIDDGGHALMVESSLEGWQELGEVWPTLDGGDRNALMSGLVGLVAHAHARGVADGGLKEDRLRLERHEDGWRVGVEGFGTRGRIWAANGKRGIAEAAQADVAWLEAMLSRWRDEASPTDPVESIEEALAAVHLEDGKGKGLAKARLALGEREEALRGPGGQERWWKYPSLFGYRHWSIQGRYEEKEDLKRIAAQVRGQRECQVALVSGATGQGGLRLGRWLAHWCLEEGWGTAHAIQHTPNPQKKGRVALRWGVRPEKREVSGGVSRWLREFGSLDEGEMAVVLVENGHWAGDTLDEVLSVMDQRQGLPVLIVVVVRPEMVVDRPIEKVIIDELRRSEASEEVELQRLDQEVLVSLTRELVPLESEWLYRVAQRSGGSPQYVVRMVRHWVESRLLEPSPVRPGRVVVNLKEGHELPMDLVALWDEELRYFTERFEEEEKVRLALEAAGTLGLEVSYDDWERLCQKLGVEVPGFLVRGLFANQIAQEMEDGEGFRFEHSLVRDVLQRWSVKAGRYRKLHDACVQMLEEQEDGGGWLYPGRLGTHYLEAGRDEEALDFLIEGAKRMGNQDDPRRALTLMVKFDAACDRLGLSKGDRRRMEAKIRRAWAHSMLLDNEAVKGLVAEVEAEMEEDEELKGSVNWIKAGVAHTEGDFEQAFEYLDRADAHFEACDSAAGLGRSRLRRSSFLRDRGQWQLAYEALGEAAEYFEACGDQKGQVIAMQSTASVQVSMERYDEARVTLEALAQREGLLGPTGIGDVYNLLGELERRSGHYEAAEEYYRQAMARWSPTRRPLVELARVNLAMTQVQRGDEVEGLSTLEEGKSYRQQHPMMRTHIYALAVELPGLATLGQWEPLIAKAETIEDFITSNDLRSPDLATLFEMTREILQEQDPPEAAIDGVDKLVASQGG